MNRALCIGINDYPGVNSDLSGCVPDAKKVHELLHSRGFGITTLLDSDATKSHIVGVMKSLAAQTKFGETSIIWYSGHGTRIPDEDGDEPDRYDEALCPYDIQDAQLITDDEIANIFSNKNRGARIILISDSCHSGTVHRLHGPISSSRNKIRFLPPTMFMDSKRLLDKEVVPVGRSRSKAKVRKTLSLLMSGCRDEEYSYDAWFDGQPNGAFTYVALRAFRDGMNYLDWWYNIRRMLPSEDFPQAPQLQGEFYCKLWKALG